MIPEAKPEISIIVPIYNVDRYLSDCLDSIISQSFRDWECILIDDGSTDNCAAICDRYAAVDSRLRIVHSENKGVSAARNIGLNLSRGRYIGFVDADDYIHPRMFETLKTLIESCQADVSEIGMFRIFTSFVSSHKWNGALKILGRDGVARGVVTGEVQSFIWNKLFRREVIDTLFPVGMEFEDVYVITEWTKNIHKMIISGEPLYYYRQRRGSIMHSNQARNRFDYLETAVAQVRAMRELEPESVTPDIFYKNMLKRVINSARDIAINVKDSSLRQSSLSEIRKEARRHKIPGPRTVGFKKWYRMNLLCWKVKAFTVVMRIFYKINYVKIRKANSLFD